MATLNWSELVSGQTYAFNPNVGGDVLHFDDAAITAGLGPDPDHQFDFFVEPDGSGGALCYFSFGGKEIALSVDPRLLTVGNVTFASGSRFKYGNATLNTGGDDKNNNINGAATDDWLAGAGGNDSLNGSIGNDMLVVSGGGSLGTGAYGNDTLNGGGGIDQVFYEGATLAINANLQTGTATGGRSGDSSMVLLQIENIVTGAGNDVVTGSAAANLIFTQEGNDRLNGAGGNDTLDGGSGVDTMIGGTGSDAYFVTSGDIVTESAGGGTDTVFSSVNRTLGNHQENLTLTGSADRQGFGNDLGNVINGNSGDNFLRGGSGNDTINGNGGADTIEGGSGNDSIDGGDGDDRMIGENGNDTYRVIEAGDIVIEDANDGIDTIITNRSIDMSVHGSVENLIWLNNDGGGFCSGNELANVMSATGGPGELTMDGNGGSDTISFAGVTQQLTIDLDLVAGSTNIVEHLVDMENAIGGLLDDDITGNEVANRLDGSAGADTMAGGYGGDTYIVDDVGDEVVEDDNIELLVLPGGSGSGLAVDDITDTVLAAIDYSLTQFVENLTLNGTARTGNGNELDNLIIGNNRNNVLNGLDGADTLNGGGGGDVLNGGVGVDVLNGGGGSDTLVWTGAGDVYNGSTGTDTIRFGAGNLKLGSLEPGVLVSIERIDLRADGANTLILTKSDVLAVSSIDTLTVLGDAGDQVRATGFSAAGQSNGLNRYTNGLATLLVESDVTVAT